MTDSMNLRDSDSEVPSFNQLPGISAGSVLDSPNNLPTTLPALREERERLADELWIDALLTQALGSSDQAHRETLVQRTLHALRRENNKQSSSPAAVAARPVARPNRRVWLTYSISAAASLVLGVLLLWSDAAPATALAAVERSLHVASEDISREYRVQITKSNTHVVPPGTLTVRGINLYVFAQPGPIGVLRVGTNGKEFWLVPPVGPVHVATEGSLLERLLSERQVSAPILSLTTVLEQLRDRYDLDLLADEHLPAADDSSRLVRCQHLRGQLRNESELFSPRGVEVWCDRSTGVVHRMVMSWPAASQSGVLQCEVDLQPSPGDLPADFYEHSGHHLPQRQVLTGPPVLGPPPSGLKLPLR